MLMNALEQIAARTATAEDLPLLERLYASVCVHEFASLGLAAEQLQTLVCMQFQMRQQGYSVTYPNAVDSVLCFADGVGIGRMLVDSSEGSLRVIDLAVLPEFRNIRIGAWALHTVQIQAAQQNLPVRLRVMKNNPALRLYKRQGFVVAGQDELSFEMEWHMVPADPGISREAMTSRIVGFLGDIGLTVELGPLSCNTFLPGIAMIANGLRVDLDRLLYPGDLLHEAGHLAVMSPERRVVAHPDPTELGEEIAATAWSYAAALHLGLPLTQVLHENGYRGSAAMLRDALAASVAPGAPLLAWMGLTTLAHPDTPSIFPRMTNWVRQMPDAPDSDAAAGQLSSQDVAPLLPAEAIFETEPVLI